MFCVPLGKKRAHWRLSNDCWVMYQIHSSWRRGGEYIQSGVLGGGGGKLMPEQACMDIAG